MLFVCREYFVEQLERIGYYAFRRDQPFSNITGKRFQHQGNRIQHLQYNDGFVCVLLSRFRNKRYTFDLELAYGIIDKVLQPQELYFG